MDSPELRLTVLGTRGSAAVSGPDYREFGGNSSCYLVQAGEKSVFLDAGSGLVFAPELSGTSPVILLSHLHLDHVSGLGMAPLLAQREQRIELYVPFCRDGQTAGSLLERVYSPPFWPVSLEELGAELCYRPLPERFSIGALQVESMEGHHPGGCMVYKLSAYGKSLVYATDYENGEESDARLAAFAEGADLMLYDAQYDEEEYEKKKGYGHSTAKMGLALMERAHIRRMLLIHHGTLSTDPVLRERERRLEKKEITYAREGQTIIL